MVTTSATTGRQPSDTTDWVDARGRMMLDPAVAYLNAGSAGPLPTVVFQQVTAYRVGQAREPIDFFFRRVPTLLGTARQRLAGYLGGDPDRLVLTTNVTGALNLVASSLRLTAPGEILLTEYEYPPMRWCWERAAQRLGLTVRLVRVPRYPTDPEEIVQAAGAAIGPRTRLFFFSHVISSTGMVMPARLLCDLAAERGVVTVIDGAHGPAFLDLDLASIGCDYYLGSGHKWLLAPTGTGFLHCARGRLDELEPLQVSWGYRTPPNDWNFDGTPGPRRFEVEGTRDICSWLALPAAIDFQEGLGPERIRARMVELAGLVRDRLAGCCGLQPVTPAQAELCGAMTAFTLPAGVDIAHLRAALWQRFQISVAVIEWSPRPLMRVSTHFFNTHHDIERLAEAIEKTVGRQSMARRTTGDGGLRRGVSTMTERAIASFSQTELREGSRREELRQALTEMGVFYLTQYGVTATDHKLPTDLAMDFFRNGTVAEKDAVTTRTPTLRRGYSNLEAESTARVTGAGEYTDYSESFSMGIGGNLFPTRAFETVWTSYFNQMYGIAQSTAREVLEAVDAHPDGGMDDLLDCDPMLRLRYFPEVPEHRVAEEEPLRMAPHYDLSIITLIHQTPCANGFVSLHVAIGDEMVPLPYVENAIVVMCGAVATLVADGAIRAPKHQVQAPPAANRIGSARTSSVFFLRPRSDFTFSTRVARRYGFDVSVQGETATFADWIGTNYVTMRTAAAAK